MKQSFINAEDYKLPMKQPTVKAAPITAAEFQSLIDRKARRDAEIDPLWRNWGRPGHWGSI